MMLRFGSVSGLFEGILFLEDRRRDSTPMVMNVGRKVNGDAHGG